MADVKHCVVCSGFGVSQLIFYSGCSLVTSKFSRRVKDQMTCCPCSAWVSEQEIFPMHSYASTMQHKCKKVRDCSFPQLPRTVWKRYRKEAWSFPHSSSRSPPATGGRVEQAAFPVWMRSQSIRAWVHSWVNELPGVDRGWGFTVGLSWSKIMLLPKGVFLTSFSFALD